MDSGASSYYFSDGKTSPLQKEATVTMLHRQEGWCPCVTSSSDNGTVTYRDDFLSALRSHRFLEDEEPDAPAPVWQTVVVAVTLAVMFGFMMTDRIGPDWVMTAGLVLFMACKIVTIPEALEGYSNDGILTVMALFVVAEGVSRTGCIDHYMGLLLGTPKTVAGAQIRLMIPIAVLSAFLNSKYTPRSASRSSDSLHACLFGS
jgi:undecaprenyl pyrophosphate phosphatase UppP